MVNPNNPIFNLATGKALLKVPQVRGMEFYPSCIEKGMRSERALKLAIAEMYVKGVSTRRVSDIVEILCGTEVSSSQVSRLAKELDEEITSWKAQPVGQIQYLVDHGYGRELTEKIAWRNWLGVLERSWGA